MKEEKKEESVERRTKSFSLKCKNADKIEEESFKIKKKQSHIVDELIEEKYGSR